MLSPTTATAVAAPLPETPYRGIEPFRYVDQPIFFARDDETRKLLRIVSVYRGVLFYGESGSGKSSLINAGFIPAVIAEGFTPERLRVQPKPGEEIVVERISTQETGQAPYLPSNFVSADQTGTRILLSTVKVRERLEQIRQLTPVRRPLLIFDQFEEFATLFEEVPRGDAVRVAQEAQQAILKMLVELLRDPTLPVKLLFSFREDYLAKMSKLVALWPDLIDQHMRLTAPGVSALPLIIRGSFETFPDHFGKQLAPALTTNLATALEARCEGGKLNLSEVEIACLELWKAKDPEKVFAQRGVQGLLETYLSDSLGRLDENLRSPAVALLSRMVTSSGTRNIVSEYDLISQVQEDDAIPENILKQALQALVEKTRLVRRERRHDAYFYDIVSEFLVPWISRQKAERIAAIQRRKLEDVERKRRRNAFGAAGISLLVAVGVFLAAALVVRERNKTIAFQQQAVYKDVVREKAVEDAQQNQKRAEMEREAAEQSRAMAELAREASEKSNADLKKQLTDLERSSDDANKKLTKLTSDNERLTQALGKVYDEVGVKADGLYKDLVDARKQQDQLRYRLENARTSDKEARQELIEAAQSAGKIASQMQSISSRLRGIGKGETGN